MIEQNLNQLHQKSNGLVNQSNLAPETIHSNDDDLKRTNQPFDRIKNNKQNLGASMFG